MMEPNNSRHAARILAGIHDLEIKDRIRDAIIAVDGDPLQLDNADLAVWAIAAERLGAPLLAPQGGFP